MMVKCPKCGSSAQPRLVKTEKIDRTNENVIREEYSCGCGCHFVVVFKPVEIYTK